MTRAEKNGGSSGLPAWLAAALVGGVALYLFWLPEVDWLRKVNPKTTAYIDRYVEQTRAAGRKPRVRMSWRSLDRIAPDLRHAVLISEDDMFYVHEGVDWDSLHHAMEYNLKKKRFARGGSTITQQVARNLFLSASKNPLRKVKEMLIARKLERRLGKRRILEIYLNIAEWGDGVYGAEAACQSYYGKSAAEVGRDEAVALAAALPSPRRWNPSRPARPWLVKRRQTILERMRKAGYLPPEEQELARGPELLPSAEAQPGQSAPR